MSDDRKLVATVVVRDDAGDVHVFGPDSKEIPGWAQDQIDNPKAWGEDAPEESRSVAEVAEEAASATAARVARRQAAADAAASDESGDDEDGDESDEDEAPRRTAKKATAKKAAAKNPTPSS